MSALERLLNVLKKNSKTHYPVVDSETLFDGIWEIAALEAVVEAVVFKLLEHLNVFKILGL